MGQNHSQNPSQSQSQIPTQALVNSINELVYQISNKQQIIQNLEFKSDSRYRFTKLPIPTIDQQSSSRNQKIKKFMGKLCKHVFQHAFAELIDGKFENNQVKIYCSQNIIYSTVQLIKKNSLEENDIKVINDCLKEDILPYISQKYPLTDGEGGNTAFEQLVIPQNNIDDDHFDLVSQSEVVFKPNLSGNYNSQIMKFLNHLINLSNSYQKKFEGDMQKLFESIFIQQNLNQYETIDVKKLRELQKTNKQMINQESLFKNILKLNLQKSKQMADYKEKVRSYTDYKIGKKIPSNIKPFTEKQISSGNFRLNSPALLRILTKWCQQLEKCFDSDNIINREKPFKIIDGSFNFLPRKSYNILLSQLLKKEQKQIIRYKQKILQHSYIMQKKLAKTDYNELKIYSNEQAVVGSFSIGVEKINESFLIGYINKLIHGILSATDTFKRVISNKDVRSLLQWPILRQDELQSLINKQLSKDFNSEDRTPNLLTFKVGDLLRCKCSSKQRQIIALYKKLEKISFQQPQKLKIVRVKNRLTKGTKDILINLLVDQKYLAQVQLAITTGKSRFIKNSNYFRHYLYELQRAQFGPINQMCNIWAQKDDRSVIYRNYFQAKMLSRDIFNKNIQCQHKYKEMQLSDICDICGYFFSANKAGQCIDVCEVCDCRRCALCRYDEIKDKEKNAQINKIISQFPKNSQDADKRFALIPMKGRIINKLVPNKKPINFIKTQTSKQIYLLEEIAKDQFQQIKSFSTNIFPSKATSIFEAKQNYIKLMRFLTQNILQESRFNLDYWQKNKSINENFIILNYFNEIRQSQKNSINLIQMNISDEVFRKFNQKIKKQSKIQDANDQKIKNKNTLDLPYLWRMNLSQNCFSDISSLVCYSQLEVLILNYNKISDFPKNRWKNLKVLQLNYNQIHNFSAQNLLYIDQNSKQQVSLIRQISLNGNNLSNLDKGFGKLKSLQKLDIGSNGLSKLPQSFGKLTSLQKLYLGNNNLSELPESIEKLISLQILDISKNKISILPQSFGKLRSLQKLYSRFNKITELPQFFGKLASLQKLDLQNNRLRKLPQSFQKLISLKKLQIAYNQLTELPQSFANLKALQLLDIRYNKLRQLPRSFGILTSLQSLDVRNNHLNNLPYTFQGLMSLRKLYIGCNRFRELPDSFGKLISLQILDMGSNVLIKLPQSFGKLTSLQKLYIGFNGLTELPDSFGKLTSLQILDIGSNGLSKLPQSFGKLTSLQNLDISVNKLNILPSSFSNLQSLQSLDLKSNQLTELPQSFGSLQSLRMINLQNNKLIKLPQSFKKISNLTLLDLRSNKLSQNLQSFLPQPINYQLFNDVNKIGQSSQFEMKMQSQQLVMDMY